MPLSAGSAARNFLNASSPPADAATATIGKPAAGVAFAGAAEGSAGAAGGSAGAAAGSCSRSRTGTDAAEAAGAGRERLARSRFVSIASGLPAARRLLFEYANDRLPDARARIPRSEGI